MVVELYSRFFGASEIARNHSGVSLKTNVHHSILRPRGKENMFGRAGRLAQQRRQTIGVRVWLKEIRGDGCER